MTEEASQSTDVKDGKTSGTSARQALPFADRLIAPLVLYGCILYSVLLMTFGALFVEGAGRQLNDFLGLSLIHI